MKQILSLLAFLLIMSGCRKHNDLNHDTPPAMTYTHFNDREINFNELFEIDLNHDNINDLYLYTRLIADPILHVDYRQYFFGSDIDTELPVNNHEEAPMLSKGNNIDSTAFGGYGWYNASEIVMAEKVISIDREPEWRGLWKNASHKYLPLRVCVGDGIYYGWVELSFNIISEKIILHNVAICKEAGKAVKAGM